MITEDFCSPEVTKLLEEKGFVKECGRIHAVCNGFTVDAIITPDAPTHQSAMKWLREKYNIVIITQPDSHKSNCSYVFGLWEGNKYEQHLTIFTTYEDAVEAALKYALENIITKEGKQ